MAEDLDHLLAVQHLLDEAVHNAQIPLLQHVIFAGQLGEVHRDGDHDAGRQDGDDSQCRVEHQHGDQGGQHRHAGVDDLGNALAEQLAQRIDIVGVHRHDVAVGVGVEVGDGQALHAMEQIIPEPAHGALAHRHHDAVVAEGRDDAHRQDGGQLEQAGGQAGKVGGAGIEHGDDVVIHQFLGEGGAGDGGHRRDQDAYNDQGKGQGVVVQHIAQHPVQHLQRRLAAGFGLIHKASSFQAGWSKSPPPFTWDS